ncbi:di-trans,poly-cis-decaprenylcistransferase [Candidatus Cerribacteria bacterium 'Amazon FNV 2010 28 9']|uniref:Isoprenyl transferase n=1 Tax=Candidatus Cerribacteria bacterium 'Amazon FNV 2010 28 9' TaxID=2081795 RepID=A0A317JQD1_9BACT|nr:MAG: di-trans,poly-cis-decaprenylcistransferase [Candidatus Cerribacteria bacterium 'Amazon FNV 2010 28 9']
MRKLERQFGDFVIPYGMAKPGGYGIQAERIFKLLRRWIPAFAGMTRKKSFIIPPMTSSTTIPHHVAIIMDGNRRWARSHGWQAIKGHEYVVDHILEPLVDRCIELGIEYLTLWAFSTENWQRDRLELEGMMQLFRRAFTHKIEELNAKGVRFRIIGNIDKFPKDIAIQAKDWVEKSAHNTKITVNFALNYGGREEILGAVNAILKEREEEKKRGRENDELVGSQEFESHLSTAGIPDPDLIIRPGGQLRLSGFLPWQSVYSELYFTDVLMPEFTVEELDKALEDYANRQRRFGK